MIFSIFLKSGQPLLKRKSISKLVETKKRLNICDIWRFKDPNTRNFTFRQYRFTGFIECQLDFIFVSNCLHKFVNNTELLLNLSADHSPLLILLLNEKFVQNVNGFFMFRK